MADSGESRAKSPVHLKALIEQDGIKIILLFPREKKQEKICQSIRVWKAASVTSCVSHSPLDEQESRKKQVAVPKM